MDLLEIMPRMEAWEASVYNKGLYISVPELNSWVEQILNKVENCLDDSCKLSTFKKALEELRDYTK